MLYVGRAYDRDRYRLLVRVKRVEPVIARRIRCAAGGRACIAGWLEQTIALLHWFRRLGIRWEIRDDIHEAFMIWAAAIVSWRRLNR
ncbi:hypothetical protein [Spongiactinospora rosea]|uniref:hypothetical protein n=1 Tax=Spongiactinospora rosea TaxID=2248750 RepID=UPI0018F2DD1C|nr:hypothetical protein [Spongiactinospora rosea]